MIRIKQLTISGFRSFEAETTVAFPESGLMLLEGDSGAGKTSIMLAIAYALDIAPSEYGQADLASWHGTPMQVSLTLVKDGNEYVFNRGRRTSVQTPAGEVTGSKAYRETLVSFLAATPEMFGLLVYRPQDTGSGFLGMSDPDRKEYLAKLLGLEAVEEAANEAAAKAAKLGAAVDALRPLAQRDAERLVEPKLELTDVSHLEAALTQTKVQFEQCSNAQTELEQALATAHAEEMAARADKVAKAEAKLAKVVQFASELRLQEAEKLAGYKVSHARLSKTVQDRKIELDSIARAKAELATARSHLEMARSGKCPNCKQTWTSEGAILDLEGTVHAFEDRVSLEPEISDSYAKASLELANLQSYKPDPDILKLVAKEQEIRNEIMDLKSNSILDPRVKELDDRVRAGARAVNEVRVAVVRHQMALEGELSANAVRKTQYQNQVRLYEADLASARMRQNEIDGLEAELKVESDLAQALGRGGFLGVIFDEVLDEIAQETNARLSLLANVSDVTIGFRSESETKAGKVRRAIVPVVSIGGVTAKYKTGLSGGMRTSVDQAVDLACREVVTRRTGVTPGFLLLDETFNGQPEKTKEAAMEVIKQFAKDNLVIVIDHSTEFRQLFDFTVKVVKMDGESKVL
jgi:DNA repair exonuclease SbcCD ATPase subunit